MKYRIAWFRKFSYETTFHCVNPSVYGQTDSYDIAVAQLRKVENMSHNADPDGRVRVDGDMVRADYTLSTGDSVIHIYRLITED